MNKKTKYLVPILFILWCFLLLIFSASQPASGYLFGGNPADTPAGTLITSEAGDNTLEYTDVNANPKGTEESATITESVEAVYGLYWTMDPNGVYKQYTSPGVTEEWNFVISCEGNAPVDWNFTSEVTYGGGTSGTDWTVKLLLATNEAEIADGASLMLQEDDIVPVILRVVPSSIEANSPDGSYAQKDAWFNFAQDYPPSGVKTMGSIYWYEGARGGGYAGHSLGGWIDPVMATYTVEVQAPVMTLTRVSTVDAPDNYGGGRHDVVPGSLISFMLYYENTGAGAATEVVVIDKVPDDTQAYKFNVQETEDNVAVTSIKEETVGTTGWYRYYTTTDNPQSFDYNGSGADHGPGNQWKLSGTSGETTMESTTTYVKWEKATVEAAEDKMIQWSVTVK